jgi:L-ascorbate metabolism protein UlaG (beta-lactamase superfamily)
MTITWLGHSCFCLEQDGYRIITDPYNGVGGYPRLQTSAHAVYCSHEHFDHNYRDGVTVLPAGKSPFTVEEFASYHDDAHGKLRGSNTIRRFTADGVSVIHLGDLGHLPSSEMVRALHGGDVLLIPVGGVYTIGPEEARQVVDSLGARCVVPMHYCHPPYGLPELTGVDQFVRLFSRENVHFLPNCVFEVTPERSGVLVPTYSGRGVEDA